MLYDKKLPSLADKIIEKAEEGKKAPKDKKGKVVSKKREKVKKSKKK